MQELHGLDAEAGEKLSAGEIVALFGNYAVIEKQLDLVLSAALDAGGKREGDVAMEGEGDEEVHQEWEAHRLPGENLWDYEVRQHNSYFYYL